MRQLITSTLLALVSGCVIQPGDRCAEVRYGEVVDTTHYWNGGNPRAYLRFDGTEVRVAETVTLTRRIIPCPLDP